MPKLSYGNGGKLEPSALLRNQPAFEIEDPSLVRDEHIRIEHYRHLSTG
jgi:hypothetical protein